MVVTGAGARPGPAGRKSDIAAGPVLPPGFVSHFNRDYEVLFPVVRP